MKFDGELHVRNLEGRNNMNHWDKIRITTDNGWNLLSKGFKKNSNKIGKVFSFQLIPISENSLSFFEENNTFRLNDPIPENTIKGHKAYISGTKYSDGYREYFLGNKYGIKCVVTNSLDIYPLLRKAHFKEKFVSVPKEIDITKEDYSEFINEYWPIVDRM